MSSSTTLTSARHIGVPHEASRCSSPWIARSWADFGNVSTLPPSSVMPKPEYTIGPKRLIAGAQHLDRHRGCAVADAAQRVEPVVVELRVLQHHVEHRRGQRRAGDAVLVDELHPQLGLEHRGQHDPTAAHVGDRHGVAGDVAQRERHQVALVGLRLVLDHRRQHRHGEVAVGEHRALREPRRPAGVQQPRGRVLVDVARWFVGRRRPDDVGVASDSGRLGPGVASITITCCSVAISPSSGSICSRYFCLRRSARWPRRC